MTSPESPVLVHARSSLIQRFPREYGSCHLAVVNLMRQLEAVDPLQTKTVNMFNRLIGNNHQSEESLHKLTIIVNLLLLLRYIPPSIQHS